MKLQSLHPSDVHCSESNLQGRFLESVKSFDCDHKRVVHEEVHIHIVQKVVADHSNNQPRGLSQIFRIHGSFLKSFCHSKINVKCFWKGESIIAILPGVHWEVVNVSAKMLIV